jgi:hypothetical protein
MCAQRFIAQPGSSNNADALFLEAARWLYSRSGGYIRTEVPNEACDFSCDV